MSFPTNGSLQSLKAKAVGGAKSSGTNYFQRRSVFVAFREGLNRGNVERRRQVIDNRIHQHLHALVLESRAGNYRDKFARKSRLADCAPEFVGFKIGFAFEEALHYVVVEIRNAFNEARPVLFGLLFIFGGNFNSVEFYALRVVFVIDKSLHRDEVYKTLQFVL